ncbi:MAG TPA: glycosyltransferase family 39 protein [Bacteroidales bacterium]|nr:glycosyltransferase family 39 protein [Bacteroidales bacterium]
MIKKLPDRLISDWPILLIAFFNVIIHMAVAGNFEYHRDELLYFSLGAHPAAGYATVPPLIGLTARVVQIVFGYSVYAVRLVPALFSGIMTFLSARIAKELGGSRYAMILSAVGMGISGFGLRTFCMFQPVFYDVFFWTLCLYVLLKYVNSSDDRYLLSFGIVAGMALLNKYLVGVMFAGLLVIIPFTRYRKIFASKWFWAGILCGFLIFLPNIIWQVRMGLPVINHMSELNRTQLVHVNRLVFFLEQFFMCSVSSVLAVAGIIYILVNRKAASYRFFGFLVLFVIVTLMLLRGKSYYTIGLYPFLFAAGAVSYEGQIRKAWTRWFFPLLLVVASLPFLPLGLPVMKSDGMVKYFNMLEKNYGIEMGRRFEDNSIHSLPQDYADMIGWGQLAEVADSAWKMIDDKKSAFIYCENYGQAGAVTVIGKKYGLPEAVCFSESFRYWFPHTFDPDIKSMVYINNREPGNDVKTFFRKVKRIGGITDPNAREYGTGVYLCLDPVDSFNRFWVLRTQDMIR